MSATAVTERPAQRTPGGGVPARRAVIRWAIRLLRREWRQQLLILALITVAVAATVVASTVATDTPAPIAGVLGTAQDAASLSGSPASVNAQIKDLEHRWGQVDVIENQSVQIPGTLNTFDLRAQDPHGPYGGPLLGLVSGQYPTTASQIAVTSGVATDFNLAIGSHWTVDGTTREVTGIVQNPQSLLDEFALVIPGPGQVVNPDTVKAQIEGGIIFGLGGALWGGATIRNGRIEQSNFHDVRVMRINEAPVVAVHLIRNLEAPGGIGEPGTAVTAGAVANAVFAATGRRVRKLPLESQLQSA